MTDLEKCKYIIASLGLNGAIHMKEKEIDVAIYEFDKYLGSIYFTLNGELLV